MRDILLGLYDDWMGLDERVETISREIEMISKQDAECRRLMSVPGIGPIISSAVVAAVGSGDAFDRGRDFGAWLGLVPKQFSTGGRTVLGGVAGLTFGYWLAKRGNIAAHRYNQTVWVLLNTVLVALIMAGSMGNAEVTNASDLAKVHIWVPWLHAVLGAATAVAGLWLVLQMNGFLPKAFHVRGWKKLMQITLAGYWAVALLGLAIYYLWFMR